MTAHPPPQSATQTASFSGTSSAGDPVVHDDAGDLEQLVAYCRDRIERGSKSFAGAARLFDEDTRRSAYMLYAWCRHADDEIDSQELGHASSTTAQTTAEARLARLTDLTLAALNGQATTPVFRALRLVVEKHDIPHQHPVELLEGFRMDVDGYRYETVDDTLCYCYHVAGVVGVMMAVIMGVRDRATLNRASDLGIAFQLTNIARDVVPDAAAGRVYIPHAWLAEQGLTLETMTDPANRSKVFAVTARLLDLADRYYDSAGIGIGALPFRAAWAIAAARNVYRDIGAIIRQRGDKAWDARAYTSKPRKLRGIAFGGLQALGAKLNVSSRPRAVTDRADLWTHPHLGETAPPLRAPGYGKAAAE